MNLTYHHERTGCVYDIRLAPDGTFAVAFCHIDRVGDDPIVYGSLDEVPDGPRHDIEQLIEENTK